jgi:rhamnose transport system substrate-binding protein
MLAIVLVACFCPGCDPAGSMSASSPADDPNSLPSPSESKPATKLVLVLTTEPTQEERTWEQVAVREAGKMAAVVDVVKPQPGDAKTRQAELVREAALHGAAALLVAPEDPETLAPALAEARDKGVAVVLLDRPVPTTGKPFTLVGRGPLLPLARQVVDAAVAEAKAVGLPPDGPALILVDSRKEPTASDRVEALKAALSERDVKVIDTLVFGPGIRRPEPDVAQKAVQDATASHGMLGMVVTEDEIGLSGANMARGPLGPKGDFVLVGLSSDQNSDSFTNIADAAAIGYMNPVEVGKTAVQLALRMVNGEAVPERTEVPWKLFKALSPRPPGGMSSRMLKAIQSR